MVTERPSLDTDRFVSWRLGFSRGRVSWDTDRTKGTDLRLPPLRPDSDRLLFELELADSPCSIPLTGDSAESLDKSASPYCTPASQRSVKIFSTSLWHVESMSLCPFMTLQFQRKLSSVVHFFFRSSCDSEFFFLSLEDFFVEPPLALVTLVRSDEASPLEKSFVKS